MIYKNLKSITSTWFNHAISWLLPYQCVLCDATTQNKLDLCQACLEELPWLQSACRICAQPLLHHDDNVICGECIKCQPAYQRTLALCHYESPLPYFIQQLKFNKKLLYARLLSELMVSRIRHYYHETSLPEYIVPVPLHAKRIRERGFNQALEIAKPIAKQLQIPLLTHHVKRIRHTQAQAELPANQRRKNLRNAFAIKKPIQAKHVAIIDDVVTTGNTVCELAITLKRADIENIDVWCCARTHIDGLSQSQ